MVRPTYVQVQTMSALFPAQALTNAPGNVAAFTFGGANPPSHSGDFSSSFSNFESSDHPGKRTNEVSSVPIQVRPFREGYERACNVGDILFNLLPGMSSYSAPSVAVSEVVVNLPVTNRILLNNGPENFYNTEKGAPAFIGVFRNEMALSGKEFFVSNTDPHSRLFNVDVAGTTKTPNVWRAANYRGTDLVRVGCRVGLARYTVSGEAELRGPTVESADKYTPSDEAQMFLPVHYHKGAWMVDPVLVAYMNDTLGIEVKEEKFVVDLGIVTWLGAEHGVRDVAEAMLFCDKFQRLPHLRLCLGA